MLRYRAVPISVWFLVFLSLSSCGGKNEVKKEASKPSVFKKEKVQEGIVSVTPYQVVSREIPLGLTADGTTEASDKFEVKAPGPVKVQRVFVDAGQQVASGDALLRYDDELTELKLEVARAEVKEAEEALALGNRGEEPTSGEANAEGATEEKTEEAKTGTETGTEQPASNLLSDKTELYQAQLDRAKAQQDLLEKSLEVGQINSPIAGSVAKLKAKEGSEVAEGDVLMEITNIDPMSFTFSTPVDIVPFLEREPQIQISFSQLAGRTFSGEVAVIGTEVESASGEVEVKLNIPNSEGLLREGMKGEISVRTTGRKKVMVVPESAIVRSDHTAYVFKIDGNRVHKVAVEFHKETGGQVSVTKGLGEGDLIVSAARGGMAVLGDGGQVEMETGVRTER